MGKYIVASCEERGDLFEDITIARVVACHGQVYLFHLLQDQRLIDVDPEVVDELIDQ